MGKVGVLVRLAIQGLARAGASLSQYGVSSSQALRVLQAVEAQFGAIEVNMGARMIPYFEAAAQSLGLSREVGINVYNAVYFLFGL